MKKKRKQFGLPILIAALIAVLALAIQPVYKVYACPHFCPNTGRPFLQVISPDRTTVIFSYQLGHYAYHREVATCAESDTIVPLYDNLISEAFEFMMMGAPNWTGPVRFPPLWDTDIDSFTLNEGTNFDLIVGLKNTAAWAENNVEDYHWEFNYQVYVKRLNDHKTNDKYIDIREMIEANGFNQVVPEILEIETGFNTLDYNNRRVYIEVDDLHDLIEVMIFVDDSNNISQE